MNPQSEVAMKAGFAPHDLRQVPTLLRGEREAINAWIAEWNWHRVLFHVGTILLGAGLFGAAVGWWRAPLQAVYTAAKLPTIILLTVLGNALLNGMLAPLLGLNLRFRQSLLAMLLSFTTAAVILGAFSPLMWFLEWNAPPLATAAASRSTTFSCIQLTQAAIIAATGVVANVRLVQLLREWSGSAGAARRVLFAWLAGNLLLGSQLAWILRPFIGSPDLPLEFLRPNAFQGNFYETIFHALKQLLTG
jgi:hypothetical protein